MDNAYNLRGNHGVTGRFPIKLCLVNKFELNIRL